MISAITAPRRFIPTLSLPVLVHEVSRRVWGLRLRRTEQELALALLLMLPSAHYKGVGVRIVSLRSWIPTPPILCLRFVGSLAVATLDSRPSGSVGIELQRAGCRWRVTKSALSIASWVHNSTMATFLEAPL